MRLQVRRALVIGGSMSGLLAALALMRRGWHVEIFERVAEPLAGRGAGIVAQPELKAVLRSLGLEADRDLGVEVMTRAMFARDGQVTHQVPLQQTMTAWDRVFFLLQAALPEAQYHRGRELRGIAQGRTVIASFADGSTAQGDLLIGADGIRSTVRQYFLPKLVPPAGCEIVVRPGHRITEHLLALGQAEAQPALQFCLVPAGERGA